MTISVTKVSSSHIDKDCFGVRRFGLENSSSLLRKKSAMNMSKSTDDFLHTYIRKYIAEQLFKLIFALF
jgi:hypothetical protein